MTPVELLWSLRLEKGNQKEGKMGNWRNEAYRFHVRNSPPQCHGLNIRGLGVRS